MPESSSQRDEEGENAQEPPADSPLIGWLRRAGVDRAVAYAVMLRGWQLIGGLFSTLLFALLFTEQQQGFYYVFGNFLALQPFFELGLNIVVVNVSSHEWSKLRMTAEGAIEGDAAAASRLISLGRLIFRWYALASMLFIFIVGALGLWFFSGRPDQEVIWREPWCWLTVSTGLLLWTMPFGAMLEGCNQVANVNRFRLVQTLASHLVVWSVLFAGGALWAVVASSWVRLAFELVFLLVGYRRFFAPFFRRPQGPTISWLGELWPMQWRLAISGIFGYFALNLYGPVIFDYHGEATAGRMGMTWTLFSVMQAAALAWVQTRTPTMGRLVAQREFEQLDRLFRRLAAISTLVMAIGGVGFLVGLQVLNQVWPQLASRLLAPLPAAILFLGFLLFHLPQCQAFYIRAHKYDNLVGVSVLSSVLIGVLIWLLAVPYGPLGAAIAYVLVHGLVSLPLHTRMWMQCRRDQPRDVASV